MTGARRECRVRWCRRGSWCLSRASGSAMAARNRRSNSRRWVSTMVSGSASLAPAAPARRRSRHPGRPDGTQRDRWVGGGWSVRNLGAQVPNMELVFPECGWRTGPARTGLTRPAPKQAGSGLCRRVGCMAVWRLATRQTADKTDTTGEPMTLHVAFVNMPFADWNRPSFALSQLANSWGSLVTFASERALQVYPPSPMPTCGYCLAWSRFIDRQRSGPTERWGKWVVGCS